ncbi:MAG: CRTAC1 family protein, partial [Bacteroidetes bacterium]
MDRVRKTVHHPDHIFDSQAKIAFIDSVLARTTDPRQLIIGRFTKAGYLLENGQEEEAIAMYEAILNANRSNQEVRRNILPELGMAYLRLAERENCVLNHNADACIMPIQGGGIHQVKRGAEKAIEIYEDLLHENPEDLDSRWLVNIAYMTLGRYPQDVPKDWLIPGLDDAGEVRLNAFVDLAPDLGLRTNDRAGGVIVDDFNNDGFLDIVTSAWGMDDPMHFFFNNGDGTFTD